MSLERTGHSNGVASVSAEDFLAALRSGMDFDLSDSRLEGDIDLSLLGAEDETKEIRVASPIRLEDVTFTGRIDTRMKRIRFLRPVNFSRCSLERCDFSLAVFDEEVRFDSVVFNGIADFWMASFGTRATFFACQFKHPEGARYFRTRFKNASFLASRFDGVLRFQEAQVEGDIDFSSVRFLATTYFNSADFASARFCDAIFAGTRADFTKLRVSKDISFYAASFESPLSFTGAKIDGTLDLSHAVARQPLVLLGCQIGKQLRTPELIFDAKVEAQWEDIRSPLVNHLRQQTGEGRNGDQDDQILDSHVRWALSKAELLHWAENFRRLGSNHDARAAGYEWIRIRRMRSGLSFWARLGDALLDIPSRRGTRPWRPLWVAVAVVAAFAVLLAAIQVATDMPVLLKGADAAPGYHILLLSLEKFMPIGKPALIGSWEVHSSVAWILQIESLAGWAWVGLTAWSVRESFF